MTSTSSTRGSCSAGFGDAWESLLTAMTTYYGLLRHPFYTWLPRTQRR
ncbi:MAG: hypothetical protein R2862_00620 [Thermoanaerobaculia bacterium]